MDRLAAAVAIALLPWHASAGGDNRCPCLESFPAQWAQRWVVNGSCQLISGAEYTGSNAQGDHCYPSSYGLSSCSTWDAGRPPFCSAAVPPGWCSDQWCYVNVSNCQSTDATPSVRTIQGGQVVDVPHYSYQTCGFTSDFAKYQRAALKSAREIVTIVEGYVASMRDFIERQVSTLNSAETGTCPGFVDSCSCKQCTIGQGTWRPALGVTGPGYSVDFSSLSVTHLDGSARAIKTQAEKRAQCLSQLVQGKFKQIARLEYNDPTRMAFLQYGDQASAVYFSWPGTTFCPTSSSTFDPRFRPWYVSAVSGPKDVVIVLDKSGSMGQQGRWQLAQQAAKEVLGTLTSFDYANIVMFSNDARTFENTQVLQDVTQTKLQSMRDWIDNQIPAGGTSFRAGFQMAFQLLSRSNTASSECNKLILFLTDGEDGSQLPMSELSSLNTEGVAIFTYSFGSGADKKRPKDIACQNSGIWYHVNDGANIGQVMSGYYMYYAGALASTKQIRWTMYKELTTRNDLITGCLPSYDRSTRPPQLLGVVCMDVSTIMDISTFQSKSDYQDAMNDMNVAAATCNKVTHASSAIEALRASVSAESVCANGFANSTNQAHGGHGLRRLAAALLALPLLSAWARR